MLLVKRHSDHNSLLKGINVEISWSLFFHATMMLLAFAVLFPFAYIKSEKRPNLVLIPWSIFNIGYLLGHLVSYSPVDTHFHRKYQIFLVVLVNVALSGSFAIRFIKKNIPKLNPSKIFLRVWNFVTPFTLFILSAPQLISGLTALWAIPCVENENIDNSIGHLGPCLPVLYLILWSILQSFDIGRLPYLSLEKLVSWVYAVGGAIFILIFGTSDLNTLGAMQHFSMGVFLFLCGVLSLFYEYRLPKNINPIIWVASALLAIILYYHHQATEIAVVLHKLCGISTLLASVILIIQQYGNITEQIKRLSELLFLFTVMFLLAGMSACVQRAEEMGLDTTAYVSMVVAITLLIYTYFIFLAYFLSSEPSLSIDDRGSDCNSKNDKILYNRVDSSEFYDVQLSDLLERNPSDLTV